MMFDIILWSLIILHIRMLKNYYGAFHYIGGRDSIVGMATCCKVVRPGFKPIVAHGISCGRAGLGLLYD
jgi:hypothetical protein